MSIYNNIGNDEPVKKVLFDEIRDELRAYGICINREHPDTDLIVNTPNLVAGYYDFQHFRMEIGDKVRDINDNHLGNIYRQIYDLEARIGAQELIIKKLLEELQNKSKEDASKEQSTTETDGNGTSCS